MPIGFVRFVNLGLPTDVDVTVLNSLVRLEGLLVLVSSPAYLTLGLLVVVDLVGVGVQLHLILKLLLALQAGHCPSRSVHGVHVFPQGALVPHLGRTDLTLDWLEPVIPDVLPGGQLPTNRTDLFWLHLSLLRAGLIFLLVEVRVDNLPVS